MFESTTTRRFVIKSLGAIAAGWAASMGHAARAQPLTPRLATTHPRIWLTEEDLPRLREWASDTNAFWRDGLLPLADTMRDQMDTGLLPEGDEGGVAWTEYPSENAAQLFAFVSLVHPDAPTRADCADRAHTLLMYIMNEAARGVAEGQPFRDPYFSVFDRSRWWGAAFPLTVDWIYPLLSAEDKATIRQVFLRWIEENTTATVTGDYNHPQPVGVVNDPALLADPIMLRWAGNNYFTAHMRNIGLMALAFDAADDPGGELTGNLSQATGAWLYMVDALLRGDSRGGLTAEGFEYTPLALSYVVQFLLALHTAGQDDPSVWGAQVLLPDNPFWEELIPAYLHSLSPATAVIPDLDYLGPIHQPAWYGDGEIYAAPDFIGLLGPLGRYDELTGNSGRLGTLRWIQTHLQPGGSEMLSYRVSYGMQDAHIAMFYFLLFDPGAPEGTDSHPEVPLAHFAEGIGRLLVRTSWDEDATWFTYALGWNTVDHQHADGNTFELYRAGEWLTKERTGYGFNIGSSDYHNTLALENDPPDHNAPDDYRYAMWQRGSQWMIVAAGDPTILAMSVGDGYVYALGDATNLYNSEAELSMDIEHASRSIVWLQPDHIVIYDRATSTTEGRFKRFWLNLPAEAAVDGNVSTATTDGGQQLAITTLLPSDAAITSEPAEPLEDSGELALGEPMHFRLRVEAPGGPRDVRFLHLLQGVDPGATADEAALVESDGDGAFEGVVVGDTAVLFPVQVGAEPGELSYTVPAAAVRHLITGLVPGGGYDVVAEPAADGLRVTVRGGTTELADDGGVLSFQVGTS